MNRRSINLPRTAAVIFLVCMLWGGATAHAALRAVGAVDLATGYPAWYQDFNGTSIEPCLDQNPMCVLPPEFVLPAGALITPGPATGITALNFPIEAFYFLADNLQDVGPTLASKFVLRMALEGAFFPAVAPGAQTTFIRINLKALHGLTPNSTFVVTHPYGTFTFQTDALGNNAPRINGQSFRAQDGCAAPPCGLFDQLLPAPTTNMGPFLRAEPPAPFIVTSADGKAYIGNPLIAVEVTGSPTGNNFVQIDGPNIGGTGLNTIRNTFFTISGKLIPLSLDKTAITFLPQKPGVVTTSALVTVSNLNPVALGALTLGPIALAGANPTDYRLTPGADLCSNTALAAGAICTFSVDFIGAIPDGIKTADINVPATMTTGVPPAAIAISGFLKVSGVIDSTPPTVTSTTPANNAVDVPANHIITATFSEPVTLVTATTFILSTSGTPTVDGTVTYDAVSRIATFSSTTNLTSKVTYTATITTGVTDIAGNALAQAFVLNFLTTLPDTTPPLVTSNTPTINAVGVRIDAPITVTFNEPVDAATVNATSFFLSGGVTGTVAYDPATKTATFIPQPPLAFNQAYKVTITEDVKSLGKVPMTAPFSWSFVTNGAPSQPQLYSPANGQTGIGSSVDLMWIKSKDIDGEPVTYHLSYCANPAMFGCTPVDVASAPSVRSTFASLGGYGAGIFLAGIAIAGGVRSRRKLFFFIAVLLISGMMASACHKKSSSSDNSIVGVDPASLVTKTVTGLSPGTTYFWKVVADDGNGALIESDTWSFTTQ
jgi:hypothetical protein